MEKEKWNSKITVDADGKEDFTKAVEFWNMSINDEKCQDEDVKNILKKIEEKLDSLFVKQK